MILCERSTPFTAKKGRDSKASAAHPAIRWAMRLGVVTMTLATLAGCSSLNIGKSEFSCPGMPDGVQCMSTRDVYAATDDGQPLLTMAGDTGETRQEALGVQATPGPAYIPDPARDPVGAYVAPRLPDKPVPVRTPAEVMRIWVAPWEDTNGDLNVSGYLYTEIEPRRWVLGDPAPSSNPVLSPLTVRPKPKQAPAVQQVAAPAAQPNAAPTALQTSEATPSQEISR